MTKRLLPYLVTCSLAACAVAGSPAAALAWGAAGHHLISRAGMDMLPASLPEFLRTPEAAGAVEALGTEADRDKGVGGGFNTDLDPGHYLDLADDGTIGGAVSLSALPASRKDYDTALRMAKTNQYAVGYLPYSLIEGWQLVELDFAIWRTDRTGAKTGTDGDRFAFATDMHRREADTIRDIGYWSHFVGDASQPLHVSIHYNGWGRYPNPNDYTEDPIHAHFEGAYVRENATLAAVEAAMAPPTECGCPIQAHVARYLTATNADVAPLYALDKTGAFATATEPGTKFVVARLADGASALRDLIAEAYDASTQMNVGYPESHTVDDYERGRFAPSVAGVLGSD